MNGLPQAEFRVLGRGSSTVSNPDRNPFLYAGNTPTGDYESFGLADTANWNQSSYGPWGAVRLKVIGGDALLAEQLGREGFLIHGGSPGIFSGFRPTFGCLRLHNADMRQLIRLIANAGDDARVAKCENVTVRVTVRE